MKPFIKINSLMIALIALPVNAHHRHQNTIPILVPAPIPTPTPLVCAKPPASTLVVNVINTGAKGNGVTDDTAAIQAAINQVAGTGGTVSIPAGTYMINALKSLNLQSNMTLSLAANAVLQAIPNSADSYAIIEAYNVSNVNIIGGTLQGDRNQHDSSSHVQWADWGMGVNVMQSSNVVIERVTSQSMWGDGFYIGGDSAPSSNITLCTDTANNNRRNNTSVTYANGVLVQNSIFEKANGIEPQEGLYIEPNSGETVNNVKVLNNTFLNNAMSAIDIWDGSDVVTNVVMKGNTITNNGDGIEVHGSSGHSILNNTISGNNPLAWNGIELSDSSNITVTGNVVTASNPLIGQNSSDTVSNNTLN
jgi:parallel beta-helix repeat protein